jgi:hypothetical protein
VDSCGQLGTEQFCQLFAMTPLPNLILKSQKNLCRQVAVASFILLSAPSKVDKIAPSPFVTLGLWGRKKNMIFDIAYGSDLMDEYHYSLSAPLRTRRSI